MNDKRHLIIYWFKKIGNKDYNGVVNEIIRNR